MMLLTFLRPYTDVVRDNIGLWRKKYIRLCPLSPINWWADTER